jgi:hypothetical protein
MDMNVYDYLLVVTYNFTIFGAMVENTADARICRICTQRAAAAPVRTARWKISKLAPA